jgi:hypothetical protein
MIGNDCVVHWYDHPCLEVETHPCIHLSLGPEKVVTFSEIHNPFWTAMRPRGLSWIELAVSSTMPRSRTFPPHFAVTI